MTIALQIGVASVGIPPGKEGNMATSQRTASRAGKDLRNPKTPKQDRGPIASDLAQTPRKKK